MTLLWIIGSTFLMSLLALVGLVFVYLREHILETTLDFLIAFAAGSLIGASFFHLLPETFAESSSGLRPFLWVVVGFTLFLLMEQFMNWHHAHRKPQNERKPFTYLILMADGLHNFVGGLAIGASFLVSPRVGIITWLAAATHELPQELGDFGILVHGGWGKRKALAYNFLSALAIVPGGLVAYYLNGTVDTIALLPFAAGNFIYIAASDLIPEIKHSRDLTYDLASSGCFVAGCSLIFLSTLF